MKNLVKEFKQFISTGNMLELAVAVMLGAAVKTVIDAFVNGIMLQLVAAIVGKADFSAVVVRIALPPALMVTLPPSAASAAAMDSGAPAFFFFGLAIVVFLSR